MTVSNECGGRICVCGYVHGRVGVRTNKSMGPDIIANSGGLTHTHSQSGVGNNGIAPWIPSVAQWDGGKHNEVLIKCVSQRCTPRLMILRGSLLQLPKRSQLSFLCIIIS